jgi:hypothetical protein
MNGTLLKTEVGISEKFAIVKFIKPKFVENMLNSIENKSHSIGTQL